MNYNPSHRRAAPANPVVIVTAGELGSRAFDLLANVAADLGVRMRGQYGLAKISAREVEPGNSDDDAPRKSHRYELATSVFFSINHQPEERPQHLWSGPVGAADERGRLEAANLLRRICPLPSGSSELRAAPETNYEVYLLIDLRDHAAVLGALRFAQAISRETPHYEMTAILLTGRSSQPLQKDADSWRIGLQEIMSAHNTQKKSAGCLFHRAYLLDGVNSKRAWLDSPESMCVVAARFLLQHGFSPDRFWLREHEQFRVLENQEFSEVLGSFAVRHVTCGIERIAEEVAAVLVPKSNFNNENLPEDSRVAEQAVEDFEKEIEKLVQREHKLADVVEIRETVLTEIGKAVAAVARKNQVSRIVSFFEKLDPAILRLHSLVHVQERVRDRRSWGGKLRSQVNGAARGQNVRPVAKIESCKPKEFIFFPVPVDKLRLYWGLGILIFGAILGLCIHDNALWPLIGSLAVMFIGGLIVDMPSRPWRLERKPYGRTWVGEIGVSTAKVEVMMFREQLREFPKLVARDLPRAGFVVGGILLALLGIALAIYSLRLENLNVAPAEFLIVGMAAVAAAGLALYQPRNAPGLLTGPPPVANLIDRLVDGEMPEGPQIRSVSEYPLAYFPATFGFWRYIFLCALTICAALAILRWEVDLRNTPYPWPENLPASYAPLFVRLSVILVGAGIAFLVWPNQKVEPYGKREIIQADMRDIEAPFSVSEEIDICLLDARDWLRALWNRPEEHVDSSADETFLEVIDEKWQETLAAACEPYLEERGNAASEWAEFIKAEIRKGPTNLTRHNLAHMFTLRCVQRWLGSMLKEHDWSHLMVLLQPQPTWLGRYFQEELAPMWPVDSEPISLDCGAALVDARLQLAAAGEDLDQSTWRCRGVHWPENGDKRGLVILVRMVQGLPPHELHLLTTTGG